MRGTTYDAHIRLISGLDHVARYPQLAGLLGEMKPQDGEDDLREFAWYYLRDQAERDVWLKGSHRQSRTASFSGDGRMLAVLHFDGAILVWDLRRKKVRRTFEAPETQPFRVSLSPDGQWLALETPTSEHKHNRCDVAVWNVETGELRKRFVIFEHHVGSAVFSPDGRWLVLGQVDSGGLGNGKIVLWDPASDETRSLASPHVMFKSVGFLPDGKTLITIGPVVNVRESIVVFTELETGRELQRLGSGHEIDIGLALSPDGRLLATGAFGGRAQVWDLKTGQQIAQFREGDGVVHSLAFLNDGRVLATKAVVNPGGQEIFRFRDLATGEVRENPYPAIGVSRFIGDPGGRRLALMADDEMIRLWEPYPDPDMVAAHKEEAWAVAWAPDGHTLASASDDHTIKLWDPGTLKEKATLTGHDSLVTSLAYGPNGELASSSFDQMVRLWDGTTGKSLACWPGHTAKLYAVAFSRDGSWVASGGADEMVRIWDARSGQAVQMLATPGHGIRALAFSPNGHTLVAGGGSDFLQSWDTATWQMQRAWHDTGSCVALAFLPDNRRLVSGGEDGRIRLWDCDSDRAGPVREVLGEHTKDVFALAVSPDARTLASGGMDRTVRLWDLSTGQELICFKGLAARVNSIAFSPDGQTLAAALHDGSLRMWRAPRLTE